MDISFLKYSWLKLEIVASLYDRADNSNQQSMYLEIYKAPDVERFDKRILCYSLK